MIHTFVCPKCKDVYSKKTKTQFDGPACPTCEVQMHDLGVTAEQWQALSHEEKADLKQHMLAEYRLPQTMYLNRLSNDVHTIRNIVIFFLIVLLCTGILRSIIVSLN
jgi:hypothetical protein